MLPSPAARPSPHPSPRCTPVCSVTSRPASVLHPRGLWASDQGRDVPRVKGHRSQPWPLTPTHCSLSFETLTPAPLTSRRVSLCSTGILGRLRGSLGKRLPRRGPVPAPGKLNSKEDHVRGKDRPLEKGNQGLSKPLGLSKRPRRADRRQDRDLNAMPFSPCQHPGIPRRKAAVCSLLGLAAP